MTITASGPHKKQTKTHKHTNTVSVLTVCKKLYTVKLIIIETYLKTSQNSGNQGVFHM